jgi:undecaprenyl-diphosphatase
MQPPLWESTVLGAIHGLTEFLPISSDGHLALTEMLFDFSRPSAALHVMLRVGTLLATVVALWPRVRPALSAGFAALLRPSLFTTSAGGRDALVVLVASVPTALLGFALRRGVERWSDSPLALGLSFLGTSLVLAASSFAKPGSAEQPSVVGALLMGLAQGLAVAPGLSRSATTITVALLLGMRRERAFELSLLMSLPAMLGAGLLELPQALLGSGPWLPAALGAGAAFAAGLGGFGLLRRSVLAGHFWWYAAWVVPVSLATLALAEAWPHG